MEEQIQQLRRRLNEQVLERAEADPQWRQQLLDDPATAAGSIPEARQLQEMIETRPTTEEPPEAPTPPPIGPAQEEEYRQLSRSLTEKILDRAASDPAWKQQLLNDPDAALAEADFPETQGLDEIRQREEVRGHLDDLMSLGGSGYRTFVTCEWWCCRYTYNCRVRTTIPA